MSSTPSIHFVDARTLRSWLNDGKEIALLDVREAGQFGEGHPFFAVPAAFSRLEVDVPLLVPRRHTRTVLIDAGDGVAPRAAERLDSLGYTHVHILRGGAPAWSAAGYVLFKGVNLPSKTFGELVEHAFGTPHLSAHSLKRRQDAGEPMVLLDGRTFAEHHKMTIPSAVSVPNGELALRWHALAPDPKTPIIIHCAGRTRSIIGAQILRSLGVPNPVIALENGTQGWALAGLSLDHGSTRSDASAAPIRPQDQAAAAQLAADAGVPRLNHAQAQAWLDDPTRNTYVLDVRSAQEFAQGTLAGARHAPGGQLLQATDQTIGVRHSRVILLDHEAVRAPVIAVWLWRLGYETATVDGGIHAPLALPPANLPQVAGSAPSPISRTELSGWVTQHRPLLIDIQPSQSYRQQHAAGATWSIRPRIAADVQAHSLPGQPVLVLAPDATTAALALKELDAHNTHWAKTTDWFAADLPVESTPNSPDDASAIDYLFFVHDRHDGNLDAARRYLEWETGLIAQCQADELASFRLPQRSTH
jgi:rhodanese-related sulfurtransferase